MTLDEEKRALRVRMEAVRDEAAKRAPDAADVVARTFLSERVPRVVSGTCPMRSELDPRPLMRRLEAMGAKLALPRTGPRGTPLTFHHWASDTVLVSGRFGVTEPPPDSPVVTPDLVLVPLLAFDRRGNRLGYGAGYYDRTLRALRSNGPVRAIGLAYAAQEVERVPTGPSDERLDAILTERELISCA